MRTRNEILIELSELASSVDFLEVLMRLTNSHLNCYVDELATKDLKSVLNENEVTFLFGVWMKNMKKKQQGFSDKDKVAKHVHSLMDELHYTFLPDFSEFDPKSYSELAISNPEVIMETIFYSGTGAYDYQMIKFLEKKYKNDAIWLKENRNFLIEQAGILYNFIKMALTVKLNTKEFENITDLYSFNFNNYVFKKHPEFKKVLDQFSFNLNETLNQDFNDVGDLNQFKFRPVIKTETKYIIPLPYLLSEALYDSPFFWMITDKDYKVKAVKNRGDAAEEIVKSILEKKINSSDIFVEVDVKTFKSRTITDIDVCVIQNDKMLIIQVKSKRLTQLSKQGNIEQFQKDFKLAIQNANNQATEPIPYILQNKCKLKSKITGEYIDYSKIKEIQTMCVVLDSYPSITTHTRMFFHEAELTPIAVSIFDLELIIDYVDGFEMLFDYVRKRAKFSKYFIADNELCFFSYYLKRDLFRQPNSDMMMLDNDFAQRFDYDYYIPLMKKYHKEFILLIKDIGRNDYCFCGTGKKFKKCCG